MTCSHIFNELSKFTKNHVYEVVKGGKVRNTCFSTVLVQKLKFTLIVKVIYFLLVKVINFLVVKLIEFLLLQLHVKVNLHKK